VNRTIDPRTRLLLLVLLLVLAAGVAGYMAMTRLHGSSNAEPTAVPAPVAHPSAKKPVAHAPATRHAAASSPKRHAAPAKHATVAKAPAAKPPAASPNQLPAAIRRELAADQVVVVALYDPSAKLDASALAEARAGAKLAGSSFVKIDVRRHGVDSLNARYGAVHDPAVLVLRPPEALVVRIDGFADRDTVAQAADNAAS
jgi:hypothetical protein